MPDSSCISGVHRQSSRSKTIILGMSSLFELHDDNDALLPLPIMLKEEEQPTNNAADEKDRRCSALMLWPPLAYWPSYFKSFYQLGF
mmetsp:Transcript_27266/g.41176  ORF Transcript_27266/g.41176 Transcript_27266/m.41176 type:complete len:87 (-) Transcript_27266:92-352(-)